MILILDNLRSAQNVGALFRTADGAGVKHMYLVGITAKPPAPRQLFQTVGEKALVKTALGAEMSVPWSKVQTITPLVRKLKKEGFEILALEEGEGSIDYREWRASRGKDIALIVGNEVEGLSPKSLARADTIISLPMRGDKRSLNVSVAGGIALYHLSDTMERLNAHKTKKD